MDTTQLLDLLHNYKQGNISDETMLQSLQDNQGFEDIGFAKIDHDRAKDKDFLK